MKPEFSIRPANSSDCLEIAKLYQISSSGVADYIWSKLAEDGDDLLDVGRRRYTRRNTNFSFENCWVVVTPGDLKEQIVALLVAFPMHIDAGALEDDPVLQPYSELEEDNSYYVCGVAVHRDYQGRGIGKCLMAKAQEDAQTRGYCKISLLVFDQNTGAKRLYDDLGFEVIDSREVIPHPLIHYTGKVLLMVKSIPD